MPCYSARALGLPVDGILCTREPTYRCSQCSRLGADRRCDYPDDRHRSGSCDAWLCSRCAQAVGHDVDWCPHHAPAPVQVDLL